MKNKIGILTFIWSVNYGAKLQAWALQSVISSLGYDCELINFKRRQDKRISESLRHMKQGKIVQCVRELMLELLNLQKNMRFNAFTKNYIKLSPQKCFNLKGLRKISDRYDAIICGSDQVWNPAHAQDSQLAYLLDISSKKEIRRISYAASIGRDALDKSWELTFSRCLKKFDAISIREKSAVDLIKQLADKETPIVLDPTLLLTQEQWAQQCASVEINEPYLLVYSTGPESPPIFKKLVERCAKERGLRIVTFQKRKRFHNEMLRFPYAGPQEFLGLFSKADFVITNSFHGTAFSIIFKKQFFAVRTDNKHCRHRDLLNALAIEGRLILNDTTEHAKIADVIDYAMVENKLSALREKSINFLIKSLNNN